jgi:hypothetical protein
VHHEFDSMGLAFTDSEEGIGKLYVTNRYYRNASRVLSHTAILCRRIIWTAPDKSKVFDFDVPYITLHAVSSDPETYALPCVYCQVLNSCEHIQRCALNRACSLMKRERITLRKRISSPILELRVRVHLL